MPNKIVLTIALLFTASVVVLGQPPDNKNGVLDVPGNGCVQVPDNPVLQITSQMTLEGRVQPTWIDKSYRALCDKNQALAYSFGTESAYPQTDSCSLRVILKGTLVQGPKIAGDGIVWTHVAVTIDGAAGVIKFYVNGQMAGQTNTSPFSLTKTNEPLRIGKSDVGDQYSGKIDEFRIWNDVRTQPEIAALMNKEAKGNEQGLVGVWHFEDPRSSIAYNRSLNTGLDGSIVTPAKILLGTEPAVFQDEYEPNFFFSNAQFLAYGRVITNASLDLGDVDTYKFYVVPGDVFFFRTYPKSSRDHVNMQIEVIGGDSTTVLYSNAYEYPSIYLGCSAEGLHYVRISGNGTTNASGNYMFDIGYSGALPPDWREPNNTLPQATPIQFGDTLSAVLFPGVDINVVPDIDIYKFDAATGEIPTAYINSLYPYGGNYSYEFLKSDGTSITPTGSWPPYFTATSNGTYYFRIIPSAGAVAYFLGLFKGLEDLHRFFYDPMFLGYLGSTGLLNGTYDAYDGAYLLSVNGTNFTALPDYGLAELSGRQFVTKPQTISGLTVRRKFYVPSVASGDTLGFIRFQEILQNNTGAPITATIGISGNLGSDTETHILYTSSGDTLWTVSDYWIITDDAKSQNGGVDNDPTLTHILDGVRGADRVDSVTFTWKDSPYYEWRNIIINPGETKIYMHFAAQDSSLAWALRKGRAFSDGKFPVAALLGLSQDQSKIQNWALLPVGVEPNLAPLPKEYSLGQNFPNPFNPVTRVNYSLPKDSRVRLRVFDMLGQVVSVMANEIQSAGSYSIDFIGSSLASGIYFCRMDATSLDGSQNYASVRKMALLK